MAENAYGHEPGPAPATPAGDSGAGTAAMVLLILAVALLPAGAMLAAVSPALFLTAVGLSGLLGLIALILSIVALAGSPARKGAIIATLVCSALLLVLAVPSCAVVSLLNARRSMNAWVNEHYSAKLLPIHVRILLKASPRRCNSRSLPLRWARLASVL